ncbi:MAG: HEPN domain-containing protein [Chloroflexota bacterium]
MNSMQPLDLPLHWLERARSDLNLADVALRTPGVLYEDACFHTQQCVEKALKGYLTRLGISFPRTHVIETLLDLLKENNILIPDAVDEAFTLTQYAVQTRYPGEWEAVTLQETQQALERAAFVLTWVDGQIRSGYANDIISGA